MQFEAFVAAQADIRNAVSSTSHNVFLLTPGYSEAVARRFIDFEEPKDAAYGRVLVIRKRADDLTESVSSLEDRFKELIVH